MENFYDLSLKFQCKVRNNWGILNGWFQEAIFFFQDFPSRGNLSVNIRYLVVEFKTKQRPCFSVFEVWTENELIRLPCATKSTWNMNKNEWKRLLNKLKKASSWWKCWIMLGRGVLQFISLGKFFPHFSEHISCRNTNIASDNTHKLG